MSCILSMTTSINFKKNRISGSDFLELNQNDLEKSSEDITVQIIKQLIKSLDQFPHKAHLANFLNENPPVKTLLAPNYFSNLVLTDNLSSPPHIDSYHELWDSIIKSTMETFGMHSTSLSTLEFDCCNCPDMVVLVIIEKLWKSPSWKSQFNFVKFTKTLRKAKTAYPYEKMIQSFIFDYSEIVISPEDLSLISKRCKNIKYVRFKTLSASFTAETVAAFLENCSSLVSFTITDKPLKSRLANALKPIRDGHCSKLSYLELRNFKWKIDILKDIGRACPLINTLVVSNVITNVIAAVIVEFFVNLENFTCNSITGAGFRNLFSSWSSSSSACCQKNTRKKLKKISLEFPYITLDDLYLNSLQSFKEFPPLESLTLRFGSYFGFRHFLNLWVNSR
ncbi:15558_t:CDS:2 [Entrophospora sp. SA101]|nr:15558_t:CDS:2 [Entrophospora sp. SA101]